jgi:hypothetical protein
MLSSSKNGVHSFFGYSRALKIGVTGNTGGQFELQANHRPEHQPKHLANTNTRLEWEQKVVQAVISTPRMMYGKESKQSLKNSWECEKGWLGLYICTEYDLTYVDLPAKKSVYAPYIYLYIYIYNIYIYIYIYIYIWFWLNPFMRTGCE